MVVRGWVERPAHPFHELGAPLLLFPTGAAFFWSKTADLSPVFEGEILSIFQKASEGPAAPVGTRGVDGPLPVACSTRSWRGAPKSADRCWEIRLIFGIGQFLLLNPCFVWLIWVPGRPWQSRGSALLPGWLDIRLAKERDPRLVLPSRCLRLRLGLETSRAPG